MIKDGKALLVKGYGLANVENDVTVSSDTVHRHVAPVCSTYRTRSKHARLDAQGRPRLSRLRRGSGNNGAINSHCSSVNSFCRFFITEAQQCIRLNRKYLI